MSCTQRQGSPPSSKRQLPSTQLQHSLRASFLTFAACFEFSFRIIHITSVRSEIRAAKKPPVSRRLIAPHLYNTEERRFCFRQSNRRKFTNATHQKHCNSRTFVLYSIKSQSEKQRLRETFSKFSRIFLQIFYCPFYGT